MGIFLIFPIAFFMLSPDFFKWAALSRFGAARLPSGILSNFVLKASLAAALFALAFSDAAFLRLAAAAGLLFFFMALASAAFC